MVDEGLWEGSGDLGPDHIAHFVVGDELAGGFAAEEHHQLIAQPQVSEFENFCLHCVLPVRVLLHLVLQQVYLELQVVDLLVYDLPQLLRLVAGVACQLFVLELLQPL